MRIVGLDISKHTGYAIIEDGKRVVSGKFEVDAETLGFKGTDKYGRLVVDEYGYIDEAAVLAHLISALVDQYRPNWIYLEQTNNGRDRTAQKNLEFLHYGILRHLRDKGHSHLVRYVDTSAWRSKLNMNFTKEQKDHNKLVKQKKKRGKITKKHLAVAWASVTFGLKLLQKDNDEAEALAVAMYGHLSQVPQPVHSTEHVDISKVFPPT